MRASTSTSSRATSARTSARRAAARSPERSGVAVSASDSSDVARVIRFSELSKLFEQMLWGARRRGSSALFVERRRGGMRQSGCCLRSVSVEVLIARAGGLLQEDGRMKHLSVAIPVSAIAAVLVACAASPAPTIGDGDLAGTGQDTSHTLPAETPPKKGSSSSASSSSGGSTSGGSSSGSTSSSGGSSSGGSSSGSTSSSGGSSGASSSGGSSSGGSSSGGGGGDFACLFAPDTNSCIDCCATNHATGSKTFG